MLDRIALSAAAATLTDEERLRLQTFVGEADFFSDLLQADLAKLPAGEAIVEVGSGMGLLALELATSGHAVVAFEPESAGFGQMRMMRDLVLEHWDGPKPPVTWVDDYLAIHDARATQSKPSYAYAVNVIEHVPDIPAFLEAVLSVLQPGGHFRFICPNYAIPYEPHFEIPTLFTKKATYRVLHKQILGAAMPEPQGMWDELSWPTVGSLRAILDRMDVQYAFSSQATRGYLTRPLQDESFSARKGRAVGAIFRTAARTMPRVIGHLPVWLLPIIDCTIRA